MGLGHDRIGGTFRLADAAIDAFVRVDDQHVFPLVEALDRADIDAVHVFAANAVFGHDIGHALVPCIGRPGDLSV